MPVCPYYLQGNCRYGDKCWNTHPTGGRQGVFGGGGFDNGPGRRTVAFKDSFSTQNKFSALSQPTSKPAGQAVGNIKDLPPSQIIDMMSQEMALWEQSKMWPFSCYAYAKETDCLPGFEDVSPEEMRFEAYSAEKSGTFANHKSRMLQLVNEYKAKREQLKKPSSDTKQRLFELITNNKNKSSSSQGISAGIFGQGSTTGTGTNTGGSLFGGGSGAGSASTGIFGGSNTGTSSSIFGGSSSGGTGSLFGNTATARTGSVFGGTGSQTQSTAQTGGLFGSAQSGQATNLFQTKQNTSVFGNLGQSGQSGGVFGGSFQQQPGGLFQGNQTNAASALFGGNQTSSSSGLFQSGGTGQQGLFQQPSQPVKAPDGLFSGKKVEMSSVQGSVAAQQPQQQGAVSFSNPVSSIPAASQPVGQAVGTASQPGENSNLYTPLDQLTKEEREQFEAPMFTLGKIPTRPPPKEMVT